MSYSIEEINREIERLEKEYFNGVEVYAEQKRKTKKRKNKKLIVSIATLLAAIIAVASAHEYLHANENDYDDIFTNTTTISETLDELENIGIDTDNNEEIVVLKGAYENKNLTEHEKELIYSLSDLIKDNPYINKKSTYRNLKTLDIVYTERPEESNPNTLAYYDQFDNVITAYEKEGEIEDDVLRHELIHAIFCNFNTLNEPSFFIEGMTELLINEYFQDDPYYEENIYPFQIASCKLLCEMVGSDTVLKAFTTGNMDLIGDKLKETLGENNASDLLYNMELLFQTFTKDNELHTENLDDILKYLDYYQENNKDIDQEAFTYNRNLLECMYDEDPYYSLYNYLWMQGTVEKPYFASKLKEESIENTNNNYQYTYKY